ncbi:DUF2997 domain-containing protein [Luteolibacter flavescens]|uniref:DUF2997 domain-containing protein n=1 Tax=Luteolibacter flavescens TaxID=1859460 RepID=A0ABT3FSY6_9BACT|nr:DUF2997 domain-containing protein [Luteolibacter flavescens]MCW1886696.1 DUF2997 domain-containing protein [Luteolibacter flavescens]
MSPTGDIQVEAEGFQGKGCEASTREIEQALGNRTSRTIKPEHRHGGISVQQQQTLGGS